MKKPIKKRFWNKWILAPLDKFFNWIGLMNEGWRRIWTILIVPWTILFFFVSVETVLFNFEIAIDNARTMPHGHLVFESPFVGWALLDIFILLPLPFYLLFITKKVIKPLIGWIAEGFRHNK